MSLNKTQIIILLKVLLVCFLQMNDQHGILCTPDTKPNRIFCSAFPETKTGRILQNNKTTLNIKHKTT